MLHDRVTLCWEMLCNTPFLFVSVCRINVCLIDVSLNWELVQSIGCAFKCHRSQDIKKSKQPLNYRDNSKKAIDVGVNICCYFPFYRFWNRKKWKSDFPSSFPFWTISSPLSEIFSNFSSPSEHVYVSTSLPSYSCSGRLFTLNTFQLNVHNVPIRSQLPQRDFLLLSRVPYFAHKLESPTCEL